MDREANYVAVGAFVLLLAAMAAGFVLWYSDTGDRRAYQRHEIYFDGSVFGLSEGSSVRYLGVAVGRVVRIGLDPRDPRRVRIVADIAEDTPIESNTVARLALQGVTGLLFVDLKPADPSKAASEDVPSLDHPVIPSERSDFDVFVSSLPDVVAKAGEFLNRLNSTLSEDNVRSVGATLASLEAASKELPAAMADARRLLQDAQAAAAELRTTAATLSEVSANAGPGITAGIDQLRVAATNMAAASERIDRLLADNEASMSRFAGQGLAEIEQLVLDMRETARAFDRLGSRLEQDPSLLLYQPSRRGVEIPP